MFWRQFLLCWILIILSNHHQFTDTCILLFHVFLSIAANSGYVSLLDGQGTFIPRHLWSVIGTSLIRDDVIVLDPHLKTIIVVRMSLGCEDKSFCNNIKKMKRAAMSLECKSCDTSYCNSPFLSPEPLKKPAALSKPMTCFLYSSVLTLNKTYAFLFCILVSLSPLRCYHCAHCESEKPTEKLCHRGEVCGKFIHTGLYFYTAKLVLTTHRLDSHFILKSLNVSEIWSDTCFEC